ncbi:membrane dipeptidase [Halobacillus locisalis]|uniref:Membrane dipeptidase n=1 Tax=Halobacillus locisalis TaxID=220753 RepID=A0A838CPA3_9BACI|nr:dipeptidase [Halobacillus locisalis]MBA2173794.1 membrane dipeptidase [Halobacillus locisalis]
MSYSFIDGHNDTILRVEDTTELLKGNEHTHIDLPRAKKSMMKAGFFAMFSPSPEGMPPFEECKTDNGYEFPLPDPLPIESSQPTTHRLFSRLIKAERESDGGVKLIRSVEDLEDCLHTDQFGAIAHIEGAESIDAELNALDVYYEAGLRSLGIVWSRQNLFGTGVPYHFPSSPDIGEGLTDLGKALVKKCNELGIMLDLSHLNEKGFWDVAKYSSAPLVATHSNVHSLCPISRNLTDQQIDAIGNSNGVVGITYVVNMLREDGGIDADIPLTSITKHIHYVIDRIGIDHVVLGSDFDGATIPEAMKDITGVPLLLEQLRQEGLSEEDISKITYRNWIRVLQSTWK